MKLKHRNQKSIYWFLITETNEAIIVADDVTRNYKVIKGNGKRVSKIKTNIGIIKVMMVGNTKKN